MDTGKPNLLDVRLAVNAVHAVPLVKVALVQVLVLLCNEVMALRRLRMMIPVVSMGTRGAMRIRGWHPRSALDLLIGSAPIMIGLELRAARHISERLAL